MSGVTKSGAVIAGIGLLGGLLLRAFAVGSGYVMNLTYVHLSFWPFLTLFIFALGIATMFFGAVQSSVLTLVVFVAALLVGIYVWSLLFGFSGVFGFGVPTLGGLP
jgi:hypothetical protein